MKLIDTPNTIEQIGNITDATTFKMKSSRKAFQILSDLYSDKPLAIVRELGCNASDSMTASGKKDQPFHIHLPNALEPWLTIQDFGTGISHQNIYDIYSTYFESTKTNTNDQIGCLGLGSKSPFCYTDNFSVTSIHNGEKRIYNAYFAENGNPTIALMSATPTNEKNGVAIQIPIKQKDFESFKNAVKTAFRYFDIKPTISGDSIVWYDETAVFKGDDWMFYDKTNSYEAFAIMGGVTYPVEHRHLLDKYNIIIRKGIVMKFNMGELDFAPSREHLSYDDATIKALNDKLEKVMKELRSKVLEMILAKENILEAMRAVSYFNDRFSYYGNSQFELKNVIYNGIDITNPYKALKDIAPDVATFSKKSYRKTISVGTTYSLDRNYAWFYDDGNVKNPVNRIKMFVRDTNDNGSHLLKKDAYEKLVSSGFPADMFVAVSTLPSPSTKRKLTSSGTLVKKAKEDITIYRLGESYNVSWESEVIEPTNTTIPKYYLIKNKTWEMNYNINGLRPITDKDRLVRYCKAYGIDARKDVVLVSSRDVDKLKNRGSKSFIKFFEKMDFSWVDPKEIATIKGIGNYDEKVIKHKKFSELDPENPIAQFVIKVNHIRNKYKKYMDIIHYFSNLDEKVKGYEIENNEAMNIVAKAMLGTWSDNDMKDYLIIAKALEK